MSRHLKDPYVHASVERGLRSRAAFKLKEILAKHKSIIQQGSRVVDLGAAPGGFSVIAAQQIGKSGQLVSVDLLPMDQVVEKERGAFIQGDFCDTAIQKQVLSLLRGGAADCILSDMAPSFTGCRETDHFRSINLCEEALGFAHIALAPGGSFLCKILRGGEDSAFRSRVAKRFSTVKFVKPKASRDESSEIFLLAMGYRNRKAG